MKFMRIDFHTHAFPDRLAPGAISSLSQAGGALRPTSDGTVSGLLSQMDSAGVDVSVVLNIASRPSHHASILRSCLSMRSDRIVPFASVHPDAPDAMEALEEIARSGIRGVKFHPQYQGFDAGEEKYYPIYRKIGRLGLAAVFHAGMAIAYPPPCPASPRALRGALSAFDGSPVVAAHFGGYMLWEQAADVFRASGIYVDTSFSHGRVIVPLARRVMDAVGIDHVLFGSDSPWSDPGAEAELLLSMGLSKAEQDAVFYKNAGRLLGLELT